jgi:hypothetical protein
MPAALRTALTFSPSAPLSRHLSICLSSLRDGRWKALSPPAASSSATGSWRSIPASGGPHEPCSLPRSRGPGSPSRNRRARVPFHSSRRSDPSCFGGCGRRRGCPPKPAPRAPNRPWNSPRGRLCCRTRSVCGPCPWRRTPPLGHERYKACPYRGAFDGRASERERAAP